MIDVGDFYNKLLTYIRKDVRGKSLTIDEFNHLARIVSYEYYNHLYSQFQESNKITDSLSPFLVFNESLSLTSNNFHAVGSLAGLTYTYKHIIGNPRYQGDKPIDLVTALEYSDRSDDALTAPTVTHPIAFIGDNAGTLSLYVIPDSVTSIRIDYLKEPDEPFLDYYVNDTTYVVTTIDETTESVTVPSGSTYRDGTAGDGATPTTPVTKNFDFNEEDEPFLMALFLEKLGLQIRDSGVIEYANTQQIKNMSNE